MKKSWLFLLYICNLHPTHIGFFGQKKHYNADGSYAVETREDFLGKTTLVGDSDQINLPDTEDFFNDDDR